MKKVVVVAAVVCAVWFAFGRAKPVQVASAPPPAVVPTHSEREAPLQEVVDREHLFEMNGYQLKTVARFGLTARALAVEGYRTGREADLSPLDVAFGWGRMSESSVTERLTFSQGNRWYFWRYEGQLPIPRREIETSSANMHLIPADPSVARAFGNIRKGQIVSLSGYLVEARSKDGWSWRSSTSREDMGPGSCELIFVQAVHAR